MPHDVTGGRSKPGQQIDPRVRDAYRQGAYCVVADFFMLEVVAASLDSQSRSWSERGGFLGTVRIRPEIRADRVTRVVAALAGDEAARGVTPGDVDDPVGAEATRRLLAELRATIPNEIEGYRSWARQILGERWPAVRAIARELLRSHELDEQTVQTLLLTESTPEGE